MPEEARANQNGAAEINETLFRTADQSVSGSSGIEPEGIRSFFMMKARTSIPLLAIVCVTLLPPVLQAHPGHEMADEGFLHWLMSPDHLGWLTYAGIAALVLGRLASRKPVRMALQCGGAAVALMATLIYLAL